MKKSTTYPIPPLVEFSLETVIVEVDLLRDLMEALAQLGGSSNNIQREDFSEVIQ